MIVVPKVSHFEMYDLEPYVTEAFEYILPYFEQNSLKQFVSDKIEYVNSPRSIDTYNICFKYISLKD